MTTYERVTVLDNGNRRTYILENPKPRTVAGVACVSGFAVDDEGHDVTPRGSQANRQLCIFALSDIVRRVPLRMNLTYGMLERADRPKDPNCHYANGVE